MLERIRVAAGQPAATAARVVFASFYCLLAGCQTIPLKEEARPVRLVFDESTVGRCKPMGNFVGSQGHWYSYLFINNDVMTQGAFNDLLNHAAMAGADTVFVPRLVNLFKTSVTIFGQGFHCRGPE